MSLLFCQLLALFGQTFLILLRGLPLDLALKSIFYGSWHNMGSVPVWINLLIGLLCIFFLLINFLDFVSIAIMFWVFEVKKWLLTLFTQAQLFRWALRVVLNTLFLDCLDIWFILFLLYLNLLILNRETVYWWALAVLRGVLRNLRRRWDRWIKIWMVIL